MAVARLNYRTIGGPGGGLGGLNRGQTERHQHQHQRTVVVIGFHTASCGVSGHPRFARTGLRSFDSLSSECRKALIRIAHKPWSCPSLYSHASISRFQQTGQGQDRSVEWRGQRVGKMGKAYGVRMELVWNMYGTTRSQHANSRRGTGWDYRSEEHTS